MVGSSVIMGPQICLDLYPFGRAGKLSKPLRHTADGTGLVHGLR